MFFMSRMGSHSVERVFYGNNFHRQHVLLNVNMFLMSSLNLNNLGQSARNNTFTTVCLPVRGEIHEP